MKTRKSARQGNDYEKLGQKTDAKTLENSGISPRIRTLYSKSITLVSREIGHLRKLAIVNKLGPDEAQDLISYVKLLGEIMKQEKELYRLRKEFEAEALTRLSDADFEKKLKDFLKEKK